MNGSGEEFNWPLLISLILCVLFWAMVVGLLLWWVL
jgi:hypothetical protein